MKLKRLLLIGLALIAVSITETETKAGLLGTLESVGESVYAAAPTNFAIAPYVTYAPDAPTKVGGGLLAIYNVNNNIGVASGVDWLGRFSQVSGNVEFKLPIHPLRFLSSAQSGFAYDLTVTPLAIAGVGVPLSGDRTSSVAGIAGAGAFVTVAHLWGGALDIGGAYVNWSGAGDYSGGHYEGFMAWRKGF